MAGAVSGRGGMEQSMSGTGGPDATACTLYDATAQHQSIMQHGPTPPACPSCLPGYEQEGDSASVRTLPTYVCKGGSAKCAP
jgi:hypothetical protein